MVDVAIIGLGPVGQVLAALLGQAGHSVEAIEQFPRPYRLPRAVHLDHEAMRVLQSAGVAEALEPFMTPLRDYHWYGADGLPLLTLRSPTPALSAWEPDYLFHQPALEEALTGRLETLESVDVARGWALEHLESDGDHVRLELCATTEESPGVLVRSGERRVLAARWVLGTDGAGSPTRELLGIGRRDLGFRERWLVVDVQPHDPDALDLPSACQWCDPSRPTTHVRSGSGQRRWEFKLLPGEDAAEFNVARTWALLSPWLRPDEGHIVRQAVYEFRSLLSERMRDGRVLIAGDAAHLTPPFLGQGLCAGLRDAANIAWKLDLVLRGVANKTLLDTITAERQAQTESLITFAIDLGGMLCELDPIKARERDALVRATKAPDPAGIDPLGPGLSRADDPLGGRLGVQPLVRLDEREGRLDDLTGPRLVLLALHGDPIQGLSSGCRDTLTRLGVAVIRLDEAQDLDGRATAFLDAHNVHAVIARPDFYVFGSAKTPIDVAALVGDLGNHIPRPAPGGP